MDDGEEMKFGPGDFVECPPVTTPGSSAMSLGWSSTGRVSRLRKAALVRARNRTAATVQATPTS